MTNTTLSTHGFLAEIGSDKLQFRAIVTLLYHPREVMSRHLRFYRTDHRGGHHAVPSVSPQPYGDADTAPSWRQHSIGKAQPLLLHLSPHTLSYTHPTHTTQEPNPYNPSRTFARKTHSPSPPAPKTASPSSGWATTARTMSSALTSPKMTGLPVHVRYVTPLGRVASSARRPKRPMMEARKKEYSVTPRLG